MSIDLTKYTETELVELNRRIVDRLQLVRSARHLTELSRFSVGTVVEFAADDGRLIRGAISRLDRQTATIVSTAGSWRVSPSLLRVPGESASAAPRIVPMPANLRPD